MKRYFKKLLLTLLSIGFCTCGKSQKPLATIIVKNDLNTERSFETVTIDFSGIETSLNNDETLIIKHNSSVITQISQIIDIDDDGVGETLLFQPKIRAMAEEVYEIHKSIIKEENDSVPKCYSRFVPERTDDYAWENDRVAFRTYGPTAQKMKEDGVPAGTLSSGIDAWLKRVEYPIINKWYEKFTTGQGTYHKDTGEGLDNFHVGISRGIGGVAIKNDNTYLFSKNFVSWKTISNGPIRTSFKLTYAPWGVADSLVKETKIISLDYGQNLSKFVVKAEPRETISAGITLHKKEGSITTDIKNGWVSYWEPHGDSELGLGIVAIRGSMMGFEEFLTEKKDESNLYVHLKATDHTFTYFAGFGWQKSGKYASKKEWEKYLSDFSKKLDNPLVVMVLWH